MFFRIENKAKMPINTFKASKVLLARRIIFLFPMKSNEELLDKYCLKQYKTTLKLMCVKLLLNLDFNVDDSGDIIATFKDKKFDDIAALITYGNEHIQGSRILRTALSA